MWLIIPILLTLHVIICLLLVAAVLMQLPRSEGLGAAFGGGMTENLFGAQTTHVLTKFTVWLGVGFFVVTLLLAMAYAHNQPSGSKLERELLNSPVPATTAPAAGSGNASTAQPTGSAIQNEPGEAAIPEQAPAGVDAPAAARPEPQPSPASP